ncbi:MAG: hypothetical protein CVV27_09705, partial [Candidatus Melainabacteria bacterium HGW-Melainabacteria-1]
EHRALAKGLHSLAVPNSADNNVSLINPETGRTLAIKAGNEPAVVAIANWDGQDRMLIIGNKASNTVTLHNLDTGVPVTLSNVGQTPTDAVLDPASNRVFITMAGSNDVAVIDYRQQKLVTRIAVGQRPVHLYSMPGQTPAEIWVGNDAGNSISILDSAAPKLKATLPVGKGHHKMAFSSGKAFVSNISDGTVSVIDRSHLSL